MKRFITFLFLLGPLGLPLSGHLAVYSQMNDGFEWPSINPDKIEIVRDSFGVAHIFAPTDAEAAYGFAWATMEDEIELPVYLLAAGKNGMGRLIGKDGAAVDYVIQLMRVREIAEEEYRTMPEDFRKVVQGSAMGYNAYISKHKDTFRDYKYLLPVEPVDIIASYMLGIALKAGVTGTMKSIANGSIAKYKPTERDTGIGSNAWAFAPSRTVDGSTYLNNNSHQPYEGLMSWYEAHVCSEEGWNIIGANYHGSLCIFHGTNEYLGWGHTTGSMDHSDVYKLEMHPKKKNLYKVDGEWLKLEQGSAKLKVRIHLKKGAKKSKRKGRQLAQADRKGIVLPVRKKIWMSIFGPTMVTEKGAYAVRMPALMTAKVAEQWWRMNKARNWEEFKAALEIQGIANQNLTYADRDGNVYQLFNGLMPDRKGKLSYHNVVMGNTREVLWDSFIPIDSLAHFLNPPSGYVFNTNNSAFHATDAEYDLDPADFNPHIGYNLDKNNRSVRFDELMEQFKGKKISWQDFLDLKFDYTFRSDTTILRDIEMDLMFEMNPQDYPEISDALERLQAWDRTADLEDRNIAIFLYTAYLINDEGRGEKEKLICESKEECMAFFADCIGRAKQHMLKHFGTLDMPLKEVQVLTRGDKEVPVDGGPDMLRAIACRASKKDGKLRPFAGDSYVELTRFPPDGGLPEIWSVLPYGASNMPDSPHYDDQMELFADHKLKRMYLDKEEVMKRAKQIYHPE